MFAASALAGAGGAGSDACCTAATTAGTETATGRGTAIGMRGAELVPGSSNVTCTGRWYHSAASASI